jgi:phage FluMu gp28-like protein
MDATEWIAASLDPATLLRSVLECDAERDCRVRMPEPWQTEFLRSRSDRILLLCSRQLGKSTCCAALALYEACFQPGGLVLMVAPVERQSLLLFEKLMRFYRLLQLVPPVRELASYLKLENGSEIVALPGDGDTIRGYSDPRLVIVDEASRVSDEVLQAMFPMLVSGGRFVATSTPKGRRGFFYHKWVGRDGGWSRINARACDSARYSPEALQEQQRVLGEDKYRVEFENQFEDDDHVAVFQRVSEAVDRGRTPAAARVEFAGFGQEHERGCKHKDYSHYMGVDFGRKKDSTVISILDEAGRQVYLDTFTHQAWEFQMSTIKEVMSIFRPLIVAEANGIGSYPSEKLDGFASELGLGAIEQFNTSGANKPELINALKSALWQGKLRLLDDRTQEDELMNYQQTITAAGNARFGNPEGPDQHDDHVIALALAWYAKSGFHVDRIGAY